MVFTSMGPAASASVMLPLAEERSTFDAMNLRVLTLVRLEA